MRVSSLDWRTIHLCAKWMETFFHVISEEAQHLHLLEQNEQIPSKHGLGHVCPNIVTDESHIIQTHSTSMGMYVSTSENMLFKNCISTSSRHFAIVFRYSSISYINYKEQWPCQAHEV